MSTTKNKKGSYTPIAHEETQPDKYGHNYDPLYQPIVGERTYDSYTDARDAGYNPAMSEAAARGQAIPEYAAAPDPTVEDWANFYRRQSQGGGAGLFVAALGAMLGGAGLIGAYGAGAGAGTAGTAGAGAGTAAGVGASAGAGTAGTAAALPAGIETVTVTGTAGGGAGGAIGAGSGVASAAGSNGNGQSDDGFDWQEQLRKQQPNMGGNNNDQQRKSEERRRQIEEENRKIEEERRRKLAEIVFNNNQLKYTDQGTDPSQLNEQQRRKLAALTGYDPNFYGVSGIGGLPGYKG